jgi:hypothetical protein
VHCAKATGSLIFIILCALSILCFFFNFIAAISIVAPLTFKPAKVVKIEAPVFMRAALFLMLFLPPMPAAAQSYRYGWSAAPLTSSYTTGSAQYPCGGYLHYKGARGGQKIEYTGGEALCLAKSDTAALILELPGIAADSISFWWEQEFSSPADAIVHLNGHPHSYLKTSAEEDISKYFAAQLAPGYILNEIRISQAANSSGQISIGTVQVFSADAPAGAVHKKLGYADITISEFMAKPYPPVYLPDCEWVELYNSTNEPIDITGLRLKINKNLLALPAASIGPKSYLVLHKGCSKFSGGNFIDVPLPVLPGSRFDISLWQEASLLYHYSYDIAELPAGPKQAGGWSVEKTGTQSRCNGCYNFSIDASGGTPGYPNSSAAACSSKQSYIESAAALCSRSLQVNFNTIQDSSVFRLENACISGLCADSIAWHHPSYRSAALFFADNFASGGINTICLDSQSFWETGLRRLCADFAAAAKPSPGDLAITEIMFDPLPGQPEYIELTNISGNAIDLYDIAIAAANIGEQIKTAKNLSDKPLLIMPGQVLAISSDTASLYSYGCSCPGRMLQLSGMPSLVNSGADVYLLSRSLQVIDSARYSSSMHHPSVKNPKGVALEYNSGPFASAAVSAPSSCGYGSPGCPNISEPQTAGMNGIAVPKKICRRSSSESLLAISGKKGCILDAYIYNETGLLVYQLANKQLLSDYEKWNWCGAAGINTEAPEGIYILLLKIDCASPKIEKYPFVLR